MTPAIRISRPDVDEAVATGDLQIDTLRPIRDAREYVELKAKLRMAEAVLRRVLSRRLSALQAGRELGVSAVMVYAWMAWIRSPVRKKRKRRY